MHNSASIQALFRSSGKKVFWPKIKVLKKNLPQMMSFLYEGNLKILTNYSETWYNYLQLREEEIASFVNRHFENKVAVRRKLLSLGNCHPLKLKL